MKRIMIAGALAILIGFQANAQSERAEAMRRVVDGLNSADPITRLVTLEEVVASDDVNLTNLAIQTALASSDPVLRSTALRETFRKKASFIVDVDLTEDHAPDGFARGTLGGKLEVFVLDFEPSSGVFQAYSPYSRYETEDGVRFYRTNESVFQGERISFTVNMQQAVNRTDALCRGAATAVEGSLALQGSMTCQWNGGSYTISIDLLN